MDNVELKRKVTLKRKVAKTDAVQPKSKWWLWVSLFVVVVGIIFSVGYFSSNDEKKGTESNDTESPISIAQGPDMEKTADATTVTEEATTHVAAEDPTAPQGNANASSEATAGVASGNQPTANPVGESSSSSQQGVLDEKVNQVIRGDFGNGAERKQKLGSEYDIIQQRVNQMYRDGEIN